MSWILSVQVQALCSLLFSGMLSSKHPNVVFFNMQFQMSGLSQPEMQSVDFLAAD